MRRIVVTGMGIVSSIGNTLEEVEQSLRAAKSGITRAEKYAEMGFRSCVHGEPQIDTDALIDRKALRFLAAGAKWNYIAMQRAIENAGLEESEVKNPRTGLVMGSGGPSLPTVMQAIDTARDRGVRKVSPFAVPKCMSSSNSATLATPFGIKGVNYSISSACSTSAHCIGHGAELIQLDKQDIVFAGGGEELDWSFSVLFDAMQAMSSKYNDSPATASRAFDVARDGFVIAGGGGVLVLEELEHAKKRGATIYAELTGYGATSDGADMVQPSGEGSIRCMEMALAEHKKKSGAEIDYINPHATSTPIGDVREIEAIHKVFGADTPPISATKSLSGHSLGAAGAHEAIFSLIMLHKNFMCESANIEELDPVFEKTPILRERRDNAKIRSVLSNSFGFGGTNATLIFAAL